MNNFVVGGLCIVTGFLAAPLITNAQPEQRPLPAYEDIPDVRVEWREIAGTPGANPLTGCYFETGMRLFMVPDDGGDYESGAVALAFDQFGCPNPGQPPG
jgi:hypothetical protein